MKKKVVIVLPTKDEEKTIEQVIKDIQSECDKSELELLKIIVTDDSRDETRRICKKLGAEIVIGGGRGLGLAMYKGLKKALEYNADFIMSLDSDGQVDVSELQNFAQPIINDEADLVVGSRFQSGKYVEYNYPKVNRFGVKVLAGIMNKVTGLKLTDSHGGFRAMKPEFVRELELIGNHTYVQETILDAYEKGFRIKEIPSIWKKRVSGKSRIVRSIPKYVFYTLPILILRSGSHINILYPVGLFFVFLSILDFIIVGIDTGFSLRELFDRQSFHLILLLFSLGVNLFFIGFTIELLGQIKRKS